MKHLKALVILPVALGALIAGKTAAAYNVYRIPASECMTSPTNFNSTPKGGSAGVAATFDNGDGLWLNTSSHSADEHAYIVCPVPDNSYFPKNTVTGAYADVYNASGVLNDSEADACVSYYNGGGGTCPDYGTSATTANGYNSIAINYPYAASNANFVWRQSARASDYPYILVYLAASSSTGAASSLQGIYLAY